MSDLSGKLSLHSFSSSLNSFFFLPDLLCTVQRLIFLERVSFADWMEVIFQSCEHVDSKFVLLKMLRTWLVLFLRLTTFL